MSDNTMPERIFAGYGILGASQQWFEVERVHFGHTTEYIRADALRAKLGGYHDSDLLSLAESLRTFHDNAEATMEAMQAQLDAANARIAELEAAQAWVSVDERLPEVGASVATKSRTGAYGVIMDVRNSGEWFYAVFSHWMPLPPPPRAE